MSEDEIIDSICEKDEQLNQLVKSGKRFEAVKRWDIKNRAGDMQHKNLLLIVHRRFSCTL